MSACFLRKNQRFGSRNEDFERDLHGFLTGISIFYLGEMEIRPHWPGNLPNWRWKKMVFDDTITIGSEKYGRKFNQSRSDTFSSEAPSLRKAQLHYASLDDRPTSLHDEGV